MDQIKTGKFIATRRKEKGLTQFQLAEALCVTDRAVSKWETGRSLPDSSIMLALCDLLEITVTELLKGEKVLMENYNKEAEKEILELVKQKEYADKMLLRVEIAIGVVCTIFFLAATVIASYINAEEWLRVVIILAGLVPFLAALPLMLKIEQKAGYYECPHCGHKYVPTYKAVNLAMHMGRTRYMKCPKCGEKSWQKKVISKD
jgi:transcriptional regulator with XRE-family HTH domain/DNA-directed RNA polymerase subunit RPC12/RpoP